MTSSYTLQHAHDDLLFELRKLVRKINDGGQNLYSAAKELESIHDTYKAARLPEWEPR